MGSFHIPREFTKTSFVFLRPLTAVVKASVAFTIVFMRVALCPETEQSVLVVAHGYEFSRKLASRRAQNQVLEHLRNSNCLNENYDRKKTANSQKVLRVLFVSVLRRRYVV